MQKEASPCASGDTRETFRRKAVEKRAEAPPATAGPASSRRRCVRVRTSRQQMDVPTKTIQLPLSPLPVPHQPDRWSCLLSEPALPSGPPSTRRGRKDRQAPRLRSGLCGVTPEAQSPLRELTCRGDGQPCHRRQRRLTDRTEHLTFS